jgi:hypothetical protein
MNKDIRHKYDCWYKVSVVYGRMLCCAIWRIDRMFTFMVLLVTEMNINFGQCVRVCVRVGVCVHVLVNVFAIS